MEFSDLESQILTYPGRVQGLGATTGEIAAAEKVLTIRFAGGFRTFLERFGWLSVEGLEIYGIGARVPKYLSLVEITLSERSEMRPKLRPDLVPVMNDGGGNLFCLDTAAGTSGSGAIVFWDHALDADQDPEIIAASFEEWLSAKLEGRRRGP
jgi:hypothetical protein